MLTVSSRDSCAGEGTPVEALFPAPKPAKSIGLKPFGFMALAQKPSPPNLLRPSHLISEVYAAKRAVFEPKDGSTCCLSRKSKDFASDGALPKPPKPIEVKTFAIIDLFHKSLPPKPLQLFPFASAVYASKMAISQQEAGYAMLRLPQADDRLAPKEERRRRAGQQPIFRQRRLSGSGQFVRLQHLFYVAKRQILERGFGRKIPRGKAEELVCYRIYRPCGIITGIAFSTWKRGACPRPLGRTSAARLTSRCALAG
jgi:hypothetical protein